MASGPNIYNILGYFPHLNQQTGMLPTFGLADIQEISMLLSLLFSTQGGIVAHPGGGQVNAVQLTATNNQVDTVTTAGDSVMLPQALPGRFVSINNNGANSLQVFGQPSNAANGGAGDTITPNTSVTPAATGVGVAQASGKCASYECFELGNWKQSISA